MFIKATIRLVKLVENDHEKKMVEITSWIDKIKISHPKADAGKYKNPAWGFYTVKNIYKKGSAWILIKD